ncbi:MAG TPA: 3'-5' exonuclease, partial [Blastocatellia bacterium]|nr:3'-5' exonuclease [Blastocatellia bacterium]
YRAESRVTLMTMHSAKGLEFPIVFIAGMEDGLFPHSRATDNEDELEEERRICYVAITRAKKNLYLTHAMKRWTFGQESPAIPSRFLNEVPRELIDDLSPGPSWFKFRELPDDSYARAGGSGFDREQRHRDRADPVKKTSNYKGKTYNSAQGVNEFFNRRGASGTGGSRTGQGSGSDQRGLSGQGSGSGAAAPPKEYADDPFKVGTRVKHAQYGRGVVLQCEGIGDEAKLTVNFPGYGRKKFVAKYAALERV